MQTIRKYRWVIVASLAFAIIFGGVFIGTSKPAYADLYGSIVKDCHYQFTSSSHSDIRRDQCPTGYASITFSLEDSSKHTYTESSKKMGCTQRIQVDGADIGNAGPIAGTLSGAYFSENMGYCEDVSFGGGSVDIQVYSPGSAASGDASDDEVKMSAYQTTVYGKLEDLVHKRCKDDPSGYCTDQMVAAVNTCTAQAMDKIKNDDKNKNDKFKVSFTACFTSQVHGYNDGSSADITRDKVLNALGDNIYNEMKDAASAALTKDGDGDFNADSCNTSGNPLTWILCPVYDGVASLSDAILNNAIVPLLKTNPISTSPDSTIYKVWSSFRVWGDIMLVIGLLVIVFGQAIGGGVFDAYTAKKVLPRLLVAAILINLSLYIVALAVDITNVIGQSIGNVITAPLNGVSLSPSGFKLGFFAAIAAVTGGAATIVAALGFVGVLGGVVGLTEFLPFIWMFVILPALIAIILVFGTLALRQAIIMALVLLSPIAFALYCLPNTEQYFKKWWDLLFNMLLVYPIVIVIFAVADLLAYTSILSSGESSFWGYLIAFLLQFIPLLMIPYAFKLAGGVLGRIHEIAAGHSKRGVEAYRGDTRDPWSRRNRYKRMASNKFLEGRESLVGRGNDWQKGGRTRSFMGRGLSGLAGMGNYEDMRSRRNKEASEMLQGHISTGGDSTVRALFARRNKDGKWEGSNGTEYTDSQVSKARSLYGRDPSMFQAAYTYELGKAANDGELEETQQRAVAIMGEQHIPDQKGVTLGAHWNHQQTRRELKHTKLQDNGKFVRNGYGFSQEVAENVSGYALSNMRTSTIQALIDDHKEAGAAIKYFNDPQSQDADVAALRAKMAQQKDYLKIRGLDSKQKAQDVQGFVTSTADALSARSQATGTYGMTQGDQEVPVSGAQAGGPGLVSQRIDKLVRIAGTPRPPRGGSGGTAGGSGGGIITPGSPDFNIPPGSLPPGS